MGIHFHNSAPLKAEGLKEECAKPFAPTETSPATSPATQLKSHEFQIVLLPGYSMLSVVSALETLQNANLCAGKEIYGWQFYRLEEDVTSSLGDACFASQLLETCSAPTDVVLVGGSDVSTLRNKKLRIWLSRYARGDTRVTGLMSGAISMAEAGLLNEIPATLHWHFRDTFEEIFSHVSLSDRNYVADFNRCSSSGGVSAIDLFLRFVEADHGEDFAMRVAENLNYVMRQPASKSTAAMFSNGNKVKNRRLRSAVKIMESNLESPISTGEIADRIGISVRQTERLFQKNLGSTPKRFYLQLRLKRAYFLLTQTEMSILDVGLACGFVSHSHFSRCFREEFGETPTSMCKF